MFFSRLLVLERKLIHRSPLQSMPRARLQRFIDSFSINSLAVWKNNDGDFRPATKSDREMTEVVRGVESQSYREVTLALEVQPMLHLSFVAVSGLGGKVRSHYVGYSAGLAASSGCLWWVRRLFSACRDMPRSPAATP